jgi:hypothetical protein
MYEKIAWQTFCKTGSLESFLEYKKIVELSSDSENLTQMKGEFLSEFGKIEGNSNKGDTV